jgi:DNA-binding response OmpR family regulator
MVMNDTSRASNPLLCPPGRSPRILVADDEYCIRFLLTELLGASGYHVEAVEDGGAAWEALRSKSYDLLITDQCMPHITGLELAQNVRAARMDLPIVMVAGERPACDPLLGLAAVLLKPFDLGELMDTVRSVLRGVAPVAMS